MCSSPTHWQRGSVANWDRNLPQYAPCKALFDGLHQGGRIASFRLAEQQMDMLGHDDVAHHNEMIAPTDVLQHFKKQVAPTGGLEQRARAGNNWW